MGEALAVGSGLARGFANVLLSKRQKDQENAVRKDTQQQQVKIALLSKGIEDGQDPNVLIPALGIDLHFGEKPQKGQPNHNEILAHFLSPAGSGLQPATEGAQKSDVVGSMKATANGELPSSTAVSPATPPPQPTVGSQGIPFLTPAQRLAQQVAATTAVEGAKLDAQTTAKMSLATRLRAADPTMSVEDSLIAVGLKVPQESFGVVPTGGGVYNKKTGDIKEAPSARVTSIPGALGERTRELQSLHPEWSEDQAKKEAATSIGEERKDAQVSREANAESLRANRAIQNTLLKLQEAQNGITPNNAAGLVTQLRRDWTKAVAPFKARDTYVAKLNEAVTPDKDGKTGIQRDRNVATQNIINSFNRLLEEGNTVREGEYARSEELAPLATKLEAWITALQSGGGKLTDAQLTSIAKEGVKIAETTKAVYEDGIRDQRNAMTRQLTRYNIPPEDVFGTSKIGGQTFATTLNGKNFVFDSQAKLDAFKRQYPAAK